MLLKEEALQSMFQLHIVQKKLTDREKYCQEELKLSAEREQAIRTYAKEFNTLALTVGTPSKKWRFR